jgi:hypothetical protein
MHILHIGGDQLAAGFADSVRLACCITFGDAAFTLAATNWPPASAGSS